MVASHRVPADRRDVARRVSVVRPAGECGNDRGTLASLIVHPPVSVDGSGQATATVTLPFTLPTSGRYFVSIRRSETDVSTVIACGNLMKGGETTSQKPGYAKAP